MSITSLIEAIPFVTTPLSLVAFLAAAVVVAQARAIGRAEALIRTAPEGDRRTLVAGALSILNLRVEKLTREQRFELAAAELRNRRHRSWLAFWISALFGLMFGGLALYAFAQRTSDPTKTLASLLSGPEKLAVIRDLKSRGIFDAEDREVVDFLVTRTAVSKGEEDKITEGELVRLASQRYSAVASVAELRRRAEGREEPFRPIGELAVSTVPGDRDDQPRQFFVHVPKNSKYAWKTIKVTNPSSNRSIRVLARPAIDETLRGTDLHLNREQSAYLNGGPQVLPKSEAIVRETSEPISDPNCSVDGRSRNFIKITKDLCGQGKSVEVAYLLNTMGR